MTNGTEMVQGASKAVADATVWQWVCGVLATLAVSLVMYAIKKKNQSGQGGEDMGALEKRVTGLEAGQGVISKRMVSMEAGQKGISKRMVGMENRLARGDERFVHIVGEISDIKDSLENACHGMRTDIQGLIGRMGDIAGQLKIIVLQNGGRHDDGGS